MIKDMEAAAVAWVGWEMDVPVLAVKAITDFVDEPLLNPLQLIKNIAMAYNKLSKALVSLMKWL